MSSYDFKRLVFSNALIRNNSYLTNVYKIGFVKGLEFGRLEAEYDLLVKFKTILEDKENRSFLFPNSVAEVVDGQSKVLNLLDKQIQDCGQRKSLLAKYYLKD